MVCKHPSAGSVCGILIHHVKYDHPSDINNCLIYVLLLLWSLRSGTHTPFPSPAPPLSITPDWVHPNPRGSLSWMVALAVWTRTARRPRRPSAHWQALKAWCWSGHLAGQGREAALVRDTDHVCLQGGERTEVPEGPGHPLLLPRALNRPCWELERLLPGSPPQRATLGEGGRAAHGWRC